MNRASALERWGVPTAGLSAVALTLLASAAGPASVRLAGAAGSAMSSTPVAGTLVFDGVTVVDVEHGKLLPAQRVVIAGNRIQAVEAMRAVKPPKGARVVDARGKYLIPGLWDLHVHPQHTAPLLYPLFLANGVTGIRDAGSEVPLDTLRLWRREILAGTRLGPPRQLFSGRSLAAPKSNCNEKFAHFACAADSAAARRLVDSFKTAGADMLKMYELSRELYFVIASEARRVGIPFGGHIQYGGPTAFEASDSGARLIDHMNMSLDYVTRCFDLDSASVERCQPVAARFRRNGTWVVPTLMIVSGASHPRSRPIIRRFAEAGREFWPASVGPTVTAQYIAKSLEVDSLAPPISAAGRLEVASRAGLPLLAGTDAPGRPTPFFGYYHLVTQPAGFSLHAELALYVAHGLSPLEALQTATLNPAKFLQGTDSLGTIAAGKLADLVLLDANPLADIANTASIRAVVAHGRYFDRAALDRLLGEVRVQAKEWPWGPR